MHAQWPASGHRLTGDRRRQAFAGGKPLEISTQRIDRIIAAAEKKGVKLAGVFQSRFKTVVQQLKALMNNGLLGEIYGGSAYIKRYRTQDYYDSGGWRGTLTFSNSRVLRMELVDPTAEEERACLDLLEQRRQLEEKEAQENKDVPPGTPGWFGRYGTYASLRGFCAGHSPRRRVVGQRARGAAFSRAGYGGVRIEQKWQCPY